ncbi:MAG: PaaI family thioesterase [Actinomycetota bacterium]
MTAEATTLIHQTMPLCATLGITAERLDADEVVLTMAWAAERCTIGDALHGGAIMALADSAGAAAAAANLPAGAIGTSTIESKTNFVGAVTEGVAVAASRVLHAGSTTIVVETEVRAGDRLVAKTTQTQIVLRPRS